jgi:TRAP-type C4-dicarboxylate transport system substrate-binding protein
VTLSVALGGFGPPSTTHSRALKIIGDRLEREGVRVKYVWNVMDLGHKAEEVLPMVERGDLTLGYMTTSYLTARVAELELLDLPFLFPSREKAHAAMDGRLGRWLSELIEQRIPAYRVLGWFENGFRHYSNKVRPVRSPADMKGLRVRCLPSRIHQRTHELLGAIACVMDLKPGIEAIKSGECTAQENPLANTVDYGVHKLHRYHTLTGHMYLSRGIFVHRPAMEAFPGEIQQVLVEAVRAAVPAQRQFAEKEDGIARRAIEEAGGEIVELTADERAAFVRAVQPLHDEARPRFRDGFSLLAT